MDTNECIQLVWEGCFLVFHVRTLAMLSIVDPLQGGIHAQSMSQLAAWLFRIWLHLYWRIFERSSLDCYQSCRDFCGWPILPEASNMLKDKSWALRTTLPQDLHSIIHYFDLEILIELATEIKWTGRVDTTCVMMYEAQQSTLFQMFKVLLRFFVISKSGVPSSLEPVANQPPGLVIPQAVAGRRLSASLRSGAGGHTGLQSSPARMIAASYVIDH